MSDFAQAGLICTLQRLNESHLLHIEAELTAAAPTCRISLVLPCHGSELERPALGHICSELRDCRWLQEIVVSMNGLDAEGYRRALRYFRERLGPVQILWNDGPALSACYRSLMTSPGSGKGLNVWAAFGWLSQRETTCVIATQDCDVSSFRRKTLARLCYACSSPRLGFSFAKMYYSRVTDRLYGRVSRLFLAPLLQATMRTAGHQPLTDFLQSFRYPLAGEWALNRELATSLPIPTGWALELAILCEVFRRTDPRMVCQVDGGSGYDHKHQPAIGGLTAMAREIAQAFLAELEVEGCQLTPALFTAIAAAYRREGELALRRSAALAWINGLSFDDAAEQEIVHAFAAALEQASALHPSTATFLPSWDLLRRTKPDWVEAWTHAVGEQQQVLNPS